MIKGEWVISFAKSHSRECALPMKATPKAVSITENTKMNFAHCTRLSWLLILYTGPFGYNGAAPPFLTDSR